MKQIDLEITALVYVPEKATFRQIGDKLSILAPDGQEVDDRLFEAGLLGAANVVSVTPSEAPEPALNDPVVSEKVSCAECGQAFVSTRGLEIHYRNSNHSRSGRPVALEESE